MEMMSDRKPHQFASVTFAAPVPKCTDADTYERWKKLRVSNESVDSKWLRAGFCEDCTPEYQAQMIACCKCENENVVFGIDEDGFYYGRLPRVRDGK